MSHASELDLSIIIVSWNTRDLLDACLRSVYEEIAAANLEAEIFVVDNGSTDKSTDMVRRCYPGVRLIENDHNPGFAKANNQALEFATGRYSMLLNPDTVVLADGLGALVRFMDESPQVGAAGARLLNANGTLQPSCSPEPTLLREMSRMFPVDDFRAHGAYTMRSWSTETPRMVDVVQGAAMIVRFEVLQKVGMLDAGYFMYSEEVDWCTRIRRAGWQIYWVPAARIIHYGGQSARQIADAMFLQLYRAKVQYFHKHWGAARADAYKLLLGFATLARIALVPLAFIEPEPLRRRHLNLARQYKLLLRSLPFL
jgi:GT2 family glycosyltransferase